MAGQVGDALAATQHRLVADVLQLLPCLLDPLLQLLPPLVLAVVPHGLRPGDRVGISLVRPALPELVRDGVDPVGGVWRASASPVTVRGG